MEKQNNLVIKVLRRLSNEGILDCAMLIINPFLRLVTSIFYFQNQYTFLRKWIWNYCSQSDLGFEISHSSNGYMKLENAELILEMLIPETGAGRNKPYPLPEIKFNAQPLRHLAMLWRKPIEVDIEGIPLKLPHPADHCLHKLIIQAKRKKKEKQEKDLESAFSVLETLLQENQIKPIFESFQKLSQKEKKVVLDNLIKRNHGELALRLKKE